jgi:hypothetical protein
MLLICGYFTPYTWKWVIITNLWCVYDVHLLLQGFIGHMNLKYHINQGSYEFLADIQAVVTWLKYDKYVLTLVLSQILT